MELRQDTTPAPEITFLTQEEVRRLLAVITRKRDRALFQLAYHHGLRASEVSLLQRDDVYAKQGRIYIPRVKGSIAKTYPLQPEDLRLVRAYLRTREDDSPSLFISTRGIPLERRSYWDLMQKYGRVADIPKPQRRFHALRHAIAGHLLDAGADVAFVQDRLGHAKAGLHRIRLHDLRHTFASLLIQNGESLAYVRDQLGHSSIQVTVDIYGHLIPGANWQAVDRLDDATICNPRATGNDKGVTAEAVTPWFSE